MKHTARWRGLFMALMVVQLVNCGPRLDERAGTEAPDTLAAREDAHRTRMPPATRWARAVRGLADDQPVAIAHDREGNVYTLGNYFSPVDLGGGLVVGSDREPVIAVLLKHRPDGTLLWHRLIVPQPSTGEPSASSFGSALAVDRAGNVHVAGRTLTPLSLREGETLPAGPFLASFDRAGNVLRARSLPIQPQGLIVERDGGFTLAGTLDRPVDFGGGPVSATSAPLIARYRADGTLRWLFVEDEDGVLLDLTQDSAGNFYIVGYHFVPSESGFDNPAPFITQVSPEGVGRWSRTLVDASGSFSSVAVHGNRVVASGFFTGTFPFADRTVSSGPRVRNLVAAFTRTGAERWAVALGDEDSFVAMDQRDGVFVTGRYAGGMDFGLGVGALPGAPGLGNLYVARLHRNDGQLEWLRPFPSSSATPEGISVTRHGAAAVIGTFGGTVDFGPVEFDNVGLGDDVFILQFER